MSDDLIRRTLEQASRKEPAVGDAWARFQVRERRWTRVRGLVAVAAGVAAITTLFLVLPGVINTGPPSDFQGQGEFEPRPALVNLYVDDLVGFEFRYPVDWSAQGERGKPVDLFQRTVDGSAPLLSDRAGREPVVERPRRFFMTVTPRKQSDPSTLLYGSAGMDRLLLAGAEMALEPLDGIGEGGERARWIFAPTPDLPDGDDGRLAYWCPRCAITEYTVAWAGGWTLEVRIVAPTEAAMRELGPLAERVVGSVATHVVPPIAAN